MTMDCKIDRVLEAIRELVAEVRLIRLAMQGQIEGERPPTDESFLRLSELAKFAGVGKRTLEKWLKLQPDPLPAHRTPDGMWLVQWGAYKDWLATINRIDDPSIQEKAEEILRELSE